MISMALTELEVHSVKAIDKQKKFFDEKGLFLLVTLTGGKYWRFKYRFNHKEKLLGLGIYPDTSLSEARIKRDDARQRLAEGVDPSEYRKANKTFKAACKVLSFETIAREWYLKHVTAWAPTHSETIIRRLERNVFPALGHRAISEITAPMLLQILRAVEARGMRETAHRILGICGQIFVYAIATARLEQNVARDLMGVIPPVKKKHLAAPKEPEQLGHLLKVIEGYEGDMITACALKLAPHVFVRPCELRNAKWADIDFDRAEWRYVVTQTQAQHIVPLSPQVIEILQALWPVTGHEIYVFASSHNSGHPISENALPSILRRLGIPKEEATVYGFRVIAKVLLQDALGFCPRTIKLQLGHVVRSFRGQIYDAIFRLDERKRMMETWSSYLDELKSK